MLRIRKTIGRYLGVVGDGTWLTIGEIAAVLGVSDTTAREYLDAGRLDEPVKAARLPSGHRRAHRDSVERLRREMYRDDPPVGSAR